MTGHLFGLSKLSSTSDREFLPAALEILETPPAPLQSALLALIHVFVAVALIWSYVSRIDIIAVAHGKVQPTGRVKILQPLETNKVVALHAVNGKVVRAGEVLIELDAGEAQAEERAAAEEYASLGAEIDRRKIAITAARDTTQGPQEVKQHLATAFGRLTVRERAVLISDFDQLAANITSLQAQRTQKIAERDRLTSTIEAEKSLLQTLQERVEMRSKSLALSVGSKSNLLDAVETLKTQTTALATQQGQKSESEASVTVLDQEIDRALKSFIADNDQKLANVERTTEAAAQRLARARVRLERLTLRAPISGTVQALAVTTIGQVVTAGSELLRIVPNNTDLEIESYLPNRDIGFVKPGQSAVVKLEAFPFTRYGMLQAAVARVAEDAIPDPDAQQLEGDPAHITSAVSYGGTQHTQNLFFPVTLRLQKTTMPTERGIDVPLKPGMAVTVEIRTGSRRILEYFLSPIIEVASRALKER